MPAKTSKPFSHYGIKCPPPIKMYRSADVGSLYKRKEQVTMSHLTSPPHTPRGLLTASSNLLLSEPFSWRWTAEVGCPSLLQAKVAFALSLNYDLSHMSMLLLYHVHSNSVQSSPPIQGSGVFHWGQLCNKLIGSKKSNNAIEAYDRLIETQDKFKRQLNA